MEMQAGQQMHDTMANISSMGLSYIDSAMPDKEGVRVMRPLRASERGRECERHYISVH